MAAFTAPSLNRQIPYIGPHGNLAVASVKYAVAAAFGNGDTVDLLRLPNGARIYDAIVVHSAFGASVVLDLGLAAVPGGATTKVGVDILIDGQSVAAAGILRRSEVGIYSDADLTLDDDYYLRAILAGADPAAGTLEVAVFYQNLGTP